MIDDVNIFQVPCMNLNQHPKHVVNWLSVLVKEVVQTANVETLILHAHHCATVNPTTLKNKNVQPELEVLLKLQSLRFFCLFDAEKISLR